MEEQEFNKEEQTKHRNINYIFMIISIFLSLFIIVFLIVSLVSSNMKLATEKDAYYTLEKEFQIVNNKYSALIDEFERRIDILNTVWDFKDGDYSLDYDNPHHTLKDLIVELDGIAYDYYEYGEYASEWGVWLQDECYDWDKVVNIDEGYESFYDDDDLQFLPMDEYFDW